MSITSAMYTGISGLTANGEAISVLGNNISNTNTVGFKSGRMLFSDVLSSSIGNNSQLGRGVQIQTVQNNFSQGSFESTENVTDLALQGDAFFIVKNPGEAQRYTRAGAFSFDKDKVMVNPDGQQVQGYGINQTTKLNNGVLGEINLTEFATQAPKMTSNITTRLNLNSNAADIPAATTFDPAIPATYNFSNSTTIYDSQGNPHAMTTYYTKRSANNWDWNAVIPDALTGGTITGTLQFNANGNGILDKSYVGASPSVTPSASTLQNITFTGVAPQTLLFDLGEGSTTQFASPSVVNTQSQNGYYQGSLAKIQVDTEGYVVGVYSNGQSQKIAQIALARFASTAGLSKVGGTLYEETLASGQALIADASTPGVGTVLSNSLEQSNVDMAAQFVKLIQAQRAFSANSKTITTSDEMTQEVLNLKR